MTAPLKVEGFAERLTIARSELPDRVTASNRTTKLISTSFSFQPARVLSTTSRPATYPAANPREGEYMIWR